MAIAWLSLLLGLANVWAGYQTFQVAVKAWRKRDWFGTVGNTMFAVIDLCVSLILIGFWLSLRHPH